MLWWIQDFLRVGGGNTGCLGGQKILDACCLWRTQRWEVVKSSASPKRPFLRKTGYILHLHLFSFRPHLFLIQRGGQTIHHINFPMGPLPRLLPRLAQNPKRGWGGGGHVPEITPPPPRSTYANSGCCSYYFLEFFKLTRAQKYR